MIADRFFRLASKGVHRLVAAITGCVLFVVALTGCGDEIGKLASMNPDKFFPDDLIPLAEAIEADDAPRTRALLEGQDVNASHREGMTLAFFALAHQSFDSLKEIVRAGADPFVGPPGLGSLAEVALRATKGTEALKALLDGGMPVDAKDRRGRPIVTIAAQGESLAPLELLLARGADLDQRDGRGDPALMSAIKSMRMQHASRLLEAGAGADPVNRSGVSAAYLVQHMGARTSREEELGRELEHLRALMIERGVSFPVATPEENREAGRVHP